MRAMWATKAPRPHDLPTDEVCDKQTWDGRTCSRQKRWHAKPEACNVAEGKVDDSKRRRREKSTVGEVDDGPTDEEGNV